MVLRSNGRNQVDFQVDDDRVVEVQQSKWYLIENGYLTNQLRERLHIVLFGDAPFGLVWDHINRDRLDNRRENLRLVTYEENQHNSKLRWDNLSGRTGIHPRGNKWRVQIHRNGQTYSIGSFDDLDDAIIARQNAEEKYK